MLLLYVDDVIPICGRGNVSVLPEFNNNPTEQPTSDKTSIACTIPLYEGHPTGRSDVRNSNQEKVFQAGYL